MSGPRQTEQCGCSCCADVTIIGYAIALGEAAVKFVVSGSMRIGAALPMIPHVLFLILSPADLGSLKTTHSCRFILVRSFCVSMCHYATRAPVMQRSCLRCRLLGSDVHFPYIVGVFFG